MSYKKPIGWWKARRLRKICTIRVFVDEEKVNKLATGLPSCLGRDIVQLRNKLAVSGKNYIEFTFFKFSPVSERSGITEDLENRGLRSINGAELLLLLSYRDKLAGRIVVSLKKQFLSKGAGLATYPAFDFRQESFGYNMVCPEHKWQKRFCFAYTKL